MTISEMPHEFLSSDKIDEELEKMEKIEHNEISSNHWFLYFIWLLFM